MTISRVIPAGVGIGEKLTSAEVNGIDQALTYAADKRAGQTDTIAAAWTVTGACTFSGSLAINGATTVGGTCTFSNTCTFGSTCTFNGTANFNGNTVIGTAVATLNDPASDFCTVNAITDFRNTTNISGALNIAADSSVLSGAHLTIFGAGSRLQTFGGGRIVHADNDYPQLPVGHTGRTLKRTARIMGSMITASKITDATNNTQLAYPTASQLQHFPAYSFFSTDCIDSSTTDAFAIAVRLNEALVDGATITNISFRFIPSVIHGAVPARLPRARAVRIDHVSSSFNVLSLYSFDYVVIPTPANVAAYNGATYVLDLPCDQYNVVDRGVNEYVAYFSNENGAGAQTNLSLLSVVVTMTVPEIRP